MDRILDRALTRRPRGVSRLRTTADLHAAVIRLARADPRLGRVVARYGPPPLWDREPGFSTLVRIILEQQVSLASAGAAYDRLAAETAVDPDGVLSLDDATLRRVGFSRQKAAYVRALAQEIRRGEFDPQVLGERSDADARQLLLARKGLGAWSADIYLLMALGRTDIWPSGDLALAVAVQRVCRLRARPDGMAMERIAERWRPWRAVAARILWHYYLSDRANWARSRTVRI